MKKTLITIIALLAMATSAAFASDTLPTRTIAGKTYYVYTVRSTDTLDSLTSQLGLSRAELLRYNPSASDGLKTGQLLIFPVGEYTGSADTAEKTADTQEYTSYTVKGNETIFGVAHRFGISPETIAELNPQAASGVRQGMVLKIPANADSYQTGNIAVQASQAPETPLDIAEQTASSVDNAGTYSSSAFAENSTASGIAEDVVNSVDSSSSALELVEVTEVVAPPVFCDDTIHITLALPLMSESEKVNKTANNYNEFYRGFLVGAQSLAEADRESGSDVTPISISLIDTSVSSLTSASISDAQFVITGEEDSEINHAISVADDETYIFNVFNLKGEQYLSHANVVHANVNQAIMYDRAIDYLLSNYADYTPVILSREGSRAEKQGFIDALRTAIAVAGRDIIEIPYSGKLSEENAELQADGRYIFIPTSGSLTDFNHFASTIKKMREADATPERLKVFGYPDWIAFRGEPRKLMQQIGVSFYSRFADIEGNPEAAKVLDAYTAWYGSSATEGIPNQALLGYDTARFLIDGLRHSPSVEEFLSADNTFEGVQSSNHFMKASGSESGYINNAIFIITCTPEGSVNQTIK